MHTQTKESQAALTPAKALELLRQGNVRFAENVKANRNLIHQVNETAEGQFPLAVVLGCVDSRVSAELVFDQGVGDIFSTRIAGNVVNEDVLGSMEFACKLAGSKLIVVLGHSSCGAVKGACSGAKMGHLTGLLAKIRPSIERVLHADGEMAGDALHQAVAEMNVEAVVREIQARSPIIREMIEAQDVGIVGAMYSVQSGLVRFGDLIQHSA